MISRKKRRLLDQKREIMEVAGSLFSEKGYHNVTMQEIARMSEFSVGKLYSFFENKEALYHALVLEKAKEFHRAIISQVRSPGDPVETMERVIKTQVELFLENIDALRLYLDVSHPWGGSLHAGLTGPVKKLYDECLDEIADLFQKGIESGRIKKGDPYFYALALDGMICSLLVDLAQGGHLEGLRAQDVISIFFSGIMKGDDK